MPAHHSKDAFNCRNGGREGGGMFIFQIKTPESLFDK